MLLLANPERSGTSALAVVGAARATTAAAVKTLLNNFISVLLALGSPASSYSVRFQVIPG
jgi:cytochrome c oxidase assembly factor CtaG